MNFVELYCTVPEVGAVYQCVNLDLVATMESDCESPRWNGVMGTGLFSAQGHLIAVVDQDPGEILRAERLGAFDAAR